MNKEKLPVLSDKELENHYKWVDEGDGYNQIQEWNIKTLLQAQRDDTWQKAQAYYEPIIRGFEVDIKRYQYFIELYQSVKEVVSEKFQQAKAEVAREIFKEIEKKYGDRPDRITIPKIGWQSLKDRFLKKG